MAARSLSINRPIAGTARLRATALAAALLATAVAALGAPGPADAKTPRHFYGVSAVEPDASDFQRMGSGRVGTYRLLLNWAAVQPERGRPYDWSGPDAEIAAAARNGIQPLPYVYGSPVFAASSPQAPPLDSPTARAGWQAFVAAAARRYGPGGEFWRLNPAIRPRPVRVWQVWNEQNADAFWVAPSPQRYAELLRLTRTAVKRVTPRAKLVLGGMYGYPNEDGSIHSTDFLKRLYDVKGVKRDFDAASVHPYGGTIRLMRYQVKAARRIMNREGDRRSKILVSEIGWSTDGPPGWPIVTTERGQAKKLRQAFGMLLENRRRWRIDRVVWFAWRDFDADICRWCSDAGLIARNGDAKPAWREFTKFTRGS
jgi:hypothetical protein